MAGYNCLHTARFACLRRPLAEEQAARTFPRKIETPP